LTLNAAPLVRSILSPSQTETTPLVPSTTLGNAHSSHGICCRNRDLGRQCCDRVSARPPYLRSSLTSCMHSPVALGVFSASFFVVLASLLVISAQPTILRLVLFFYSASPLSRWAITRGWQRHLVSWYKSRRAARICVWIKDDDVCLPSVCHCTACVSIPLTQIYVMLRALLSVQKNVSDARTVIFVHAYKGINAIPSELHPNARLLDEAFPTITVE
jgi:hypothetical protein